ncbi:hypothetical protein SFRURICE_014417 [Spodoptera frugiperda]|uniref:Uncharacterized protein LOC118267978 isoform X1 n=2 Tax=Spodoptera frugiperda TaxID=7108 RepID=A0A9R0D2S6_SPOFR|nr:uncharacterized protein LOC118267978 isoform X1 [Spodoptera frugiperda]KAF9817264.1 hypothetical protein SFRURICE_014417 [Spodoptera frugiperda]
MGFFKVFGFIVIYLTCTLSFNNADPCEMRGPCVCVFSNGTGIDLTPAISTEFYTASTYEVKMNGSQYEMSTYYYHPCYDVNLNVSQSIPKNTCTLPLSICRHVSTMNLANSTTQTFTFDQGSYDFMGRTNISNFSDQGNSINYPNGPSETIVLLECAETENKLQVYSLSEPDKIVLAFYSKDACLKQIEVNGRSFGSTLLIIFFSFVVFYLVLGICTKKFLMGATGVEVIPNLAFWSDLPNLVKDGWRFMCNGFKLPPRGAGPAVSPDPNSYDSI